MPFNLLKNYNDLLELDALDERERKSSLMRVFDRDISNNEDFNFKGKKITPTPKDGVIKMSNLFTHLTTVITDKHTNQREYDRHRAVRLHWIKYHIEQCKSENILIFSTKEGRDKRTYIYDKDEKYVIVLEPLRNGVSYYLLTAYHLRGKDAKRNSIEKKYSRRLPELL